MIHASPDGRLWARWALDPLFGPADGIELAWAAGRILRVERRSRPPADLPPDHVHDHLLLTPGFLNAHVHLDYSFLRGRLPRGAGFAAWLREMIRVRRESRDGPASPESPLAAVREAAGALAGDGVTEIWDIVSDVLEKDPLAGTRPQRPPRRIRFHEFIAPRFHDWQRAWKCFQGRTEDTAPGNHRENPGGISPHSAYTLPPAAMRAAAEWAKANGKPIAIHLAESPEEREMLVDGRGNLLELLRELTGTDPLLELGWGQSPIARAIEAGLVGPSTLCIHCNVPEPGELEQLARRGAAVVFCPLSHAFFGYPPYPLGDIIRTGARFALGTDSLASNDTLSIRAELARAWALARAQVPSLDPLDALGWATGAGLGDAPPYGPRGALAPGMPAQWALWRIKDPPARPDPEAWLAALLEPETECAACNSS